MDKWITWKTFVFSRIEDAPAAFWGAFSKHVDKISTTKNSVDEMCIKVDALGITSRNYRGSLLDLSP